MKKLLLRMVFGMIIITLIFLFSACDNSDDTGNEDKILIPETTVVFDNKKGACTAVVYSYYTRTEDEKIVEVPAGQVSKEFKWHHGSSVPFFFSYKINLIGIDDFDLDYVARESSKDQVSIRIDEGKNTPIPIPPLNEVVSPNSLMFDNSYIFIQNNSSFSISLSRGNSVLTPDNFSDSNINPGERARYTIKNNDIKTISSYQIRETLDYMSFPPSLGNFVPGRVYCFVYDRGSPELFETVEIKMENVVVGSLNDPPKRTYVRFINSNDYPVSVYTDYKRNNKITDIPVLGQTPSIQIFPNIGGALYYPNYNIVIEGVSIFYEGKVIVTRIDAGKTQQNPNIVIIPELEYLDEDELKKPLVSSAYIKIHNDVSSSLALQLDSENLNPQGSKSTIVNGCETAIYVINSGNALNYSFRRNNTNPINFPDNFTKFESGNLYSFKYDGVKLILLTEKPLTLKQAFSPSVPTGVTATTRGTNSILLSWNDANNVSNYLIHRGSSSNNVDLFVVATSSTSYLVDDLEDKTGYWFTIIAENNYGISSPTIAVYEETYQINPPDTPTDLVWPVRGRDERPPSVYLEWSLVSGATGYYVYRSLNASGPYLNVGSSDINKFSDVGLNNNTNYYYKVSAYNGSGESSQSSYIMVTTSGENKGVSPIG